mmetsp:Transcript_101443/g.325981  ORF Transcript_101443/g.325981 Transcript_101443/m.325981 type:complete len:834 (+) Transcript_101443:46-2547(+)|eukprot:CAMPEP_0203875386 /NCGR_PEP_ID=MMETSP0359-20131031/20786_1 /ASSEMBLY_ACC=CAM_ASM_000338 /TAXON_ID=268821 /ORGANISM="Scrippsiella Hangoei, Strain SHTV-5" /LENGTH=833 /DNA_ID=CAMNT_0050794195 /DNA_START=46 /DNA_END=2547 /DNA_ORIENTATION=+
MTPLCLCIVVLYSVLLRAVVGEQSADEAQASAGPYVAVERMDMRRILMRVPENAPLPPADEEVMLDQIEQWKWRVEMAAAGAAVLVTSSQCPHGLGLLPSTLAWKGGGHWRKWPGTFEYSTGSLISGSRLKWSAIHESQACQGASGIKILGEEMKGTDLEGCQRKCGETAGCEAVDYYKKTQWCIMYDRPCSAPDKSHDGASSWKLQLGPEGEGALHADFFTFLDAKRYCQELDACRGFSYSGTWSDQDRIAPGVPRKVYFARGSTVMPAKGGQKWYSYLTKDNPRANCNPEGAQFDCPANPYACLGLSIDADEHAIKQAYRALGKQLHPDKLKKAQRTKEAVKQAEEAFRDISESHEALRDPGKRRQIDQKLRQLRKQWEEQRASVQDLYIKEPLVTSLEPESYPGLIPHAQEWLVHFFLPQNDDCKQTKIAMARAAADLGTGEAERGIAAAGGASAGRRTLSEGDIFRGVIREKSVALRTDGAGIAEGDTHIALLVLSKSKVKLFILGEELEMTLSVDQPQGNEHRLSMEGKERVFNCRFDRTQPGWLRGTIAEVSRRDHDVSSFALKRDDWWRDHHFSNGTLIPGMRTKPRLYGAVNCGRFPDFCKRKGADPSVPKRFPQVRMLFPDEVRFEIYRGRPLGREVFAFAREASRAPGEVQVLNSTDLQTMQTALPSLWLLYLQREGSSSSKSSSLDCQLCRSVLPVLRRTAPRLRAAGLQIGSVNCTAHASACRSFTNADGTEDADGLPAGTPEWGTLRLVEVGTSSPGGAPPAPGGPPVRSFALWDQQLLVGDAGQSVLISAVDAAASMAELMLPRTAEKTAQRSSAKGEL